MRFAIYDPVTGRVKRVITCTTQEQGEANAHDGEAAARIGLADDDSTIYIDQGAAMPMPPRPSAAHEFDWALKQWYDPRTLADFKALKWAQIKAARTAAIDGGFTAAGYTFDSDEVARQNIMQAAQAALMAKVDNQPFSVDWTLADDSTVTLTRAQTIALGQALQAHVAAQHNKARTLRAQIAAATTREQVEAIVW